MAYYYCYCSSYRRFLPASGGGGGGCDAAAAASSRRRGFSSSSFSSLSSLLLLMMFVFFAAIISICNGFSSLSLTATTTTTTKSCCHCPLTSSWKKQYHHHHHHHRLTTTTTYSAANDDNNNNENQEEGEEKSAVVVDTDSNNNKKKNIEIRTTAAGTSEEGEGEGNLRTRAMTSREAMAALGTSPRRIALSLIAGAGIALGGNLFGITSLILAGIDEEKVEQTGLDTYFARGNYKRYLAPDYTFVIPKEWVADQYLELAKAQRMTQSLDYSMNKRSSNSNAIIPDAAFGPPGRLNSRGVSQGDTPNVSVIRTNAGPNFSLKDTMKTPTEGAMFLLNNSIAPAGSGKTATLVDAFENEDGKSLYQFEYQVDRGDSHNSRTRYFRAISVVAQTATNNRLITLTVTAPETDWSQQQNPEMDTKLRKIVSSFHLR